MEHPTHIVLIVEDDNVIRSVLARLMAREGYIATTATNGRQAVELVRSGVHPDVVVMDYWLPEMDGLTALRLMREDAEFDGTPVILHTAIDQPQVHEEARKLGVVGYVVKGLKAWPALREAVRKYAA